MAYQILLYNKIVIAEIVGDDGGTDKRSRWKNGDHRNQPDLYGDLMCDKILSQLSGTKSGIFNK